MYWRRFNLTGEPFSLTPDPAFLYLSSVHAEAYAALTMGLKERRGLVSMIGEVGTGKTTLVYSLLSSLGPEIHTAYISNARLSFDGILRSALRDFGVANEDLHGVQLLDAFNEFLHRCAKDGTTAALVIDEAQNLSHDTFEDLRLLSNFETYKTKLLQIVLVGQPELDTKLRDPALRQVAERIAVRCHVNPLTPQETRHYIEHRLNAVGGSIDTFSEPAIRTIISRSAGIPRAVNILCHNAMLFAYGQAKDKIARSMVLEAVHEKEGSGLVRLGSRQGNGNFPSLPGVQMNTPAWTWNAVFLILAVGLSIAMIRVAGNIRFAPSEPQAPALTAAPLPVETEVVDSDTQLEQPGQQAPLAVAEQAPAPVVAPLVAAPPVEQEPEPIAEQATPALPVAPVQPIAPGGNEQELAEDPAVAPATANSAATAVGTDAIAEPASEPAADPEPAAAVIEEEVAVDAPADLIDEPVSVEYEIDVTDSAEELATAPRDPNVLGSESQGEVLEALDYETAAPSASAAAILTEPIIDNSDQELEIQLDASQQGVVSDGTALALLNSDTSPLTDSPYQIIDVEPGNSLSDLMIAIYGHYTNTMVQRVQALNPQITDPNVILAGDALRFPSDWAPAYPSAPEQQQ